MLKNIFIIGFCIWNVVLLIQIGIEVSAVTPEQAMLEGVTQRIYASITTLDYIMATLWGVILISILTASKEWFLRAAFLYVGFFLCDIHFNFYMSVEMNEPEWIIEPLLYVFVQILFIAWADKQINVSNYAYD